MASEISFFIYAFVSLFAIVNPVSGVMAFISLTAQMTPADRLYVAKRSSVIACIIAIIFSISGEYILQKLFNITVDHLRVAGGILLFVVAMDMLFARPTRESITSEEITDAAKREDVSIFPMAMPMLTGPGAITTTILVTQQAGEDIVLKFVVIGAILTTFILIGLQAAVCSLRSEWRIVAGFRIRRASLGLFLGAIAVDFISLGIKGIYTSLF